MGHLAKKIRCVDCRWFPTKVIRIWPWVVVSVIRNFYRLCSTLLWPNYNFFSEAISNSRTLNNRTLRVICRSEFDSWKKNAQNIWKMLENKGFLPKVDILLINLKCKCKYVCRHPGPLRILARLRLPPAAFLLNRAITRGANGTKTFPWLCQSYMQSFIKIGVLVFEKNGNKIMTLCNFNKDTCSFP